MITQYNRPAVSVNTDPAQSVTAPVPASAQGRIAVLEQQVHRQHRRIRDLEQQIADVTSHLRRTQG